MSNTLREEWLEVCDELDKLKVENTRLHTGEGHAGCDVQTCEIAAVASDESSEVAEADVFRPAALAAVAYLAAHAALAAAGVSEDRPAAARRVADAWIALTRACAEIPAGGPEPIRQAEPDWRAVATGLIKLVYARVSGPKIVDEVEAILQAYATPAGGPEQDRGAAALRPAGSVDHAFLPHPWGKDICDAKIDEDGRVRTCARPRREHGEGGHSRRCTENADDPACPHPTCAAGGEP